MIAQVATRDHALKSFKNFLPNAGRHYAQNRNFDEGPARRTHVSELSPFIGCGLIHESEILSEIIKKHGSQEAEKFIQELLWRAYWRSWLELRPQLWQHYCRQISSRYDSCEYLKATNASTGIEAFDTWTRELIETGYLHNHARMWFASIWIHTLGLPWAWGAAFFYEHLLDGDLAANTLSWRWVAGLHTPGKYYLATPANIERFSERKFTISQLATTPMLSQEEIDLTPSLTSNHAAILGESWSLLISCEYLGLDELFKAKPPKHVFVLPASYLAHKLGKSERWREFIDQAQKDCMSRFKKRFEIECEFIDPKIFDFSRHQLAYFRSLQPAISELYQELCPKAEYLQTNYERELQGLAKKGFFDFWKKSKLENLYPLKLLSL